MRTHETTKTTLKITEKERQALTELIESLNPEQIEKLKGLLILYSKIKTFRR